MAVHQWDFTRQFTVGMSVVIASTLATGAIALAGMHQVASSADRVATVYAENALAASRLDNALERTSGAARQYLLTGEAPALAEWRETRELLDARLRALGAVTSGDEGRALGERIEASHRRYVATLERVIALRAGATSSAVEPSFQRDVVPAKVELETLITEFELRKEQQLESAERASDLATRRAAVLVGALAGVSLALAVGLAMLLRRGVTALARSRAVTAASLSRVEQANRDLDAFAGRVAHDLRGVLAPVLLAPSLLRGRELTPATVEGVCRRIDRAVERAVGLVDALLAFSRAGATPDAKASASVPETVRAVVDELDARIAQSDAKVDVELAEGEVRCPPGLFHIVVSNLVGNAAKFIRDAPTREVRIRGQVVRGGYELRIEDTGPGIPEGALPRIFEPFYRVPDTKAGGTGIGLATVRRVVDAYGGRITVDSTVGAGTSFRVWLPLFALPAEGDSERTNLGALH